MRSWQRHFKWALPISLLLLALFLRFYRLGAQSLWADEGNSVSLAGRSLSTITRDAADDIHPPLYYYLLHFWTRLFGTGELALRGLSALLGTALVMGTYSLGRRLLGPWVGMLAGILSALSPLQIYYSQETRMYILAALLSLVALYLLLLWLEEVERRQGEDLGQLYLLGCAALTLLCLYTHYFAFTIFLVGNALFALWWLRRRLEGRVAIGLRWALAQAIVTALYLPWLYFARGRLATWPAVSEPFTLAFLLGETLKSFGLGLTLQASLTRIAMLVLGFILMVGFLPLGERARGALNPLLFAAFYLFIPLLAMYALSWRRSIYDPKFLLLATPPFYLLLARGISLPIMWSPQRRYTHLLRGASWALGVGGLLFAIGMSLRSLESYYFDKRYARDDYRGIAEYISASGRKGDAILVNAPGQMDVFTYYYKGELPIHPLPRARPLDMERTREELERMITGRERLFAVLWATDESDPKRVIEGWLDEHAFKAQDQWYGNVRLVLYAISQPPTAGEFRHLDFDLGAKVKLLGYSLAAEEVRAGEVLSLTFLWRAMEKMEERYKVFVQILDGHNYIVGQRDAEPGGGAKITTLWQPRERILDNYGVPVLPGTPPGEYRLEVGMYSLRDGRRLPVSQESQSLGDSISLTPVRVRKGKLSQDPAILGIRHRKEAIYNGVRFLGYDAFKLGHGHQPETPLHPGDILHLTLYWQATQRPGRDLALILKLIDSSGRQFLTRRSQPCEGDYPTTLWEGGELVRDQHYLILPEDLPPGRHRITLEVMDALGDRPLAPALELGTIVTR